MMHIDQAARVTRAIWHIVTNGLIRCELEAPAFRHIERMLRDEFFDARREAVADRGDADLERR
jgi:hypothetical protein